MRIFCELGKEDYYSTKKKIVILQLASILLVRVFINTLIPSVKMTLTMRKMFAGIIYVKPLNERLIILLPKKLLFWLLFSGIQNVLILSVCANDVNNTKAS